MSSSANRQIKPSWWLAPWWQHYALAVPALALAAGVAVALDRILPSILALLLGLAVVLITTLILFALAARLLLAHSATGPWLSYDELDLPERVGLRLTVLWLLAMVLVLAWWGQGNLVLLVIGSILVTLLMPAATLTLVLSGRLSEALYPPAWRDTFNELGRGACLQASAGLAVLMALYFVLAELLAGVPASIRAAMLMAWWAYGILAWFALLGQLRASAVEIRPDKPPAPAACEDLDASFDRLMHGGGDNLDYRQLFAALSQQQDLPRLEQLARLWFPTLLDGFNRPEEAIERCDRLLTQVPNFSLETPSAMLHLIKASERHGYPELTQRLCHNFLNTFPVAPKRQTVEAILSRL
ncbi:MAG: hypothetical protein EA370_03830 [Wenzhouxiangella sp.]|nr:MAG: hypothetical protein EA370_03830 [Wenzhouxiangella sp.]